METDFAGEKFKAKVLQYKKMPGVLKKLTRTVVVCQFSYSVHVGRTFLGFSFLGSVVL